MKKIFVFMIAMLMILVFSLQAQATLFDRGNDSLGNSLIYDSDLNITWYDYTESRNHWQEQIDWVADLTVNFNGQNITGWRLPTTVDGPYVFGYDGTTTAGFNITSSEMGYLFYTELGNKAAYDASGNPQAGFGLTNTGPFKNLIAEEDRGDMCYWSGTEYLARSDMAWAFAFLNGFQPLLSEEVNGEFALAVRPGDVASVPEPSTILLLGAGLVGVGIMGRKLRK